IKDGGRIFMELKEKTVFQNAKWIGKRYKLNHRNRKRDESLRHFVKSRRRRKRDQFYQSLGYQNRDFLKAPYFRKLIHLEEIKKATIYITGLGYFELYINGEKVGDDILSPPYSQYEKTVYYNEYDVTKYLQLGQNVIRVVLGNGMYNVQLQNAWSYDAAHWRGVPKFILSGFFEGKDPYYLVSDTTWKVATGPILFNDIYGGEVYDARNDLVGLDEVDFDDSSMNEAIVYKSPTETLKPLEMEPIKIIDEIEPVNFWQVGEKKWIFDLGLNISGFIRLQAKARRGTEVILSYGEVISNKLLDREGILEHTVNKHQKYIQRDKYIFAGDQVETWHPRFTYHAFQYVEIEGLEKVDNSTITGLITHTSVAQVGNFKCSDELLNQIFAAGNRSNLNNYQGIPTDCPHREKNGWTGDVHLSIEYALLTYRCENLMKKWLFDICDAQRKDGKIPAIAPTPGWGYGGTGPAWDSAFILIPWNIYLYRGNRELLLDLYPYMKKYMNWQDSRIRNNLIRFGLGDWCSPNRKANKPKAPIALTSSAYHFETFKIMSKIAKVLGKLSDAEQFDKRNRELCTAINENFIDQDTGDVKGDCQTSYSAVLYFNLVSEDLKPKILAKLIDQVKLHNYHVDTGILGTRYLLYELTEHGYGDIAYKIATQTDFPSWGDWIKQGATTLWEQWDGTNSRNHRMFGSISSWFYHYLAGIRPDEEHPGLQHMIIRPTFIEGLDFVQAETLTENGKVSVEWKREGDRIHLFIEAPTSCKISVCIDQEHTDRMIHHHKHKVTAQEI
ncbi:MAG: family 78 glycoside hydrolase catalytic domain, partial [Promethearchaeota archaeon]